MRGPDDNRARAGASAPDRITPAQRRKASLRRH